jgi:Rab proteins geranylgeranyltransferase component A
MPSNYHLVSGSKVQLDFDWHVDEAKQLFDLITPNSDFLPRPPNVEDIIFEGETTTTTTPTEEKVEIEPIEDQK